MVTTAPMIQKRFKKKADMSIVSNLPFNYKFLPNIDLAQRYFDQSLVYDLVITLDVAAIDRVRDAKIFFDKILIITKQIQLMVITI